MLEGYLKIICGCMYAGKSTELLKEIQKYTHLKKNIMVINHIYDDRHGTKSLSTHDGKTYEDCIIAEELTEIKIKYKKQYESADVIIVNELQFFKDCYKVIIDWLDNDCKTIICAGLDGDYLKEPFGDLVKLIPHCDDIVKLKSYCNICNNGTGALFSKKIINDGKLISVGGEGKYIPVCRTHYK